MGLPTGIDVSISDFTAIIGSTPRLRGDVTVYLPEGNILRGIIGPEFSGTVEYVNSKLRFAMREGVTLYAKVDIGVTVVEILITRLAIDRQAEMEVEGTITIDGRTMDLEMGKDMSGNMYLFADIGDSGINIDLPGLFQASLKNKFGFKTMGPLQAIYLEDMSLNAGIKPWRAISGRTTDFFYLTPTSIPPMGFGFFDDMSMSVYMAGFEVNAGLSFPPPEGDDLIKLLSVMADAVVGGEIDWGKLGELSAPAFGIRDVYMKFPEIPGIGHDNLFVQLFGGDRIQFIDSKGFSAKPKDVLKLANSFNMYEIVNVMIPGDKPFEHNLEINLPWFSGEAKVALKEEKKIVEVDAIPQLPDLYQHISRVRYAYETVMEQIEDPVLSGTLNLDGVNDYVTVPDNGALRLGTNHTIEAWIRIDENVNKKTLIIGKGYNYRLWRQANGVIKYDFLATNRKRLNVASIMKIKDKRWGWRGNKFRTRSFKITAGSGWHHIAVTYDRKNAKIYIDGRIINSQPFSGGPIRPRSQLVFGRAGPSFFKGSMGEVRLWNITRTAEEIKTAMNASLIGNEPGLVAFWTFDKIDDTTVIEGRGKYNGTLHGIDDDKADEIINVSLPKQFGGGNAAVKLVEVDDGLTFDGVDDYMEIPSNPQINQGIHSQRTIELWFMVKDRDISSRKQVIFEEGGSGRGINAYVFNSLLYVGGWNTPTSESGWASTFFSSELVQSDKWHHLAVVLDGSSTIADDSLTAYLDGDKIGSGAGSQLWGHDTLSIGAVVRNTKLHDGNYRRNGHWLHGAISDIRLWNVARTQPQIRDAMHLTPATDSLGLISHWNLDRIDGETANDSLGNNHGVVSGAVPVNGFNNIPQIYPEVTVDEQTIFLHPGGSIASSYTFDTVDIQPPDKKDGFSQFTINSAEGKAFNFDIMNVGGFDSARVGLKALKFDGTNRYAEVPNSSTINQGIFPKRTFELWFKADDKTISTRKQVLFEEGGSGRGINACKDHVLIANTIKRLSFACLIKRPMSDQPSFCTH